MFFSSTALLKQVPLTTQNRYAYSKFHEKYCKGIDDIICRADEKMRNDKKSIKTEKHDGKLTVPKNLFAE